MTVSSETKRADYTGNGSTTDFATVFRFLQNSDVKVILTVTATGVETVQAETTNYTLVGDGLDAGGTVTMLVAPPIGTTLTIKRDVPLTQGTDYVENDSFPAESHETALDKLTMIVQQIQEEIDRSVKFAEAEDTAISTLPALQALKFLRIKSDLSGIELVDGTTSVVPSDIPYDQGGTGSVENNVEGKLQEIISIFDSIGSNADGTGATDYQVGIVAAVAEAFARGAILSWPHGVGGVTYLTTATIPNLHDVRHIGPGKIKRGTDTFTVVPKDADTNKLYVALVGDGGLAANDGLTSSQPMLLLQNAFDALVDYGPVLEGTWDIALAAGSYETLGSGTRIAELKSGLLSKNPIIVRGPSIGGHPNVPTAFLGRAAAPQTSGNGIFITNGSRLKVIDIKVRNLNGLGLSADTQCELKTENVHTENIGNFGISAISLCDLEVMGGIIDGVDNTNNGIRSLFGCRHTVGDQTGASIANGPVIKNCGTGMLAQESATGHNDFVDFQDNTFAIQATVNSRVNASGSDFKRNTVAMRTDLGGIILDDNVVLNIGGANANTENYRTKSGGWQAANGTYNTWNVADLDFVTDNTTGTTAEQDAKTFVLEAGRWASVPSSIYQGKAVRFHAAGTITGTAGTKSFRMRIGTSLLLGLVLDADANGSFDYEGVVFFTTSATQKIRVRGVTQNGAKRTEVGYGTATVNTDSATDQDLKLTVQLGNAADAIDIEIFEVEVQG
jgi:hypothetical protein